MTHLEEVNKEIDAVMNDAEKLGPPTTDTAIAMIVSYSIAQVQATAMIADEIVNLIRRIDEIGPILQGIEANTSYA